MLRLITWILWRLPGAASRFGRNRFERYVGHPVPRHVRDVRAQSTPNVTAFSFEPPFDRGGLLAGFDASGASGWPVHSLLLGPMVGTPTRHFYRVIPAAAHTVWLYLNDAEGKGAILALG